MRQIPAFLLAVTVSVIVNGILEPRMYPLNRWWIAATLVTVTTLTYIGFRKLRPRT